MVKVPEYDVKLLLQELEVKIGRKMTAHAASVGISVALKWIEKSVKLTPNQLDDSVVLLYPALIKLISTKIDLKEYKVDFELEKAFDIQALLGELEKQGLKLAEETVVDFIEVSLRWIQESARASENPYDDIVDVIIPVVIAPLSEMIDRISPDVDSKIDPSNPDHDDVEETEEV